MLKKLLRLAPLVSQMFRKRNSLTRGFEAIPTADQEKGYLDMVISTFQMLRGAAADLRSGFDQAREDFHHS